MTRADIEYVAHALFGFGWALIPGTYQEVDWHCYGVCLRRRDGETAWLAVRVGDRDGQLAVSFSSRAAADSAINRWISQAALRPAPLATHRSTHRSAPCEDAPTTRLVIVVATILVVAALVFAALTATGVIA